MIIRIYPTFDAYFYAALLKAIFEEHGSHNVRYSCDGFPPLDRRCFAFTVEPIGRKVILDQIDDPKLNRQGLEWCDVYSKSNVVAELIPSGQAGKICVTGPCFPVRFCGPIATAWNASRNYLLRPAPNLRKSREHFANWWRQCKYRFAEREYAPESYKPGYVFFSATIWKKEPECNQYRARFMEACRSLDWLQFEGGFMPRPENDVPGFEAFTVPQHYSHRQYVAKTKQSTVAFNTPSVAGCHPWRLAEYMALGKAMISTPLIRPLPAPLKHGEQVHFVDGSLGSIREAICLLFKDADYRRHLERGAREYFLKYFQGRSMIKRVMAHASRLIPILVSDCTLLETCQMSSCLTGFV